MGTTRMELLQWLNDLLQLNYTKAEQCETRAAYCQIMDSIYGDVPMSRVKMDAKPEYDSLPNYKILRTVFTLKNIDKVWRLSSVSLFDATKARRCELGMKFSLGYTDRGTRQMQTAQDEKWAELQGHVHRRCDPRSCSKLQQELTQNKQDAEAPDSKRDFYFNKLCDIEIIVQEQLDALEAEGQTDATLKKIQETLHKTVREEIAECAHEYFR
ncbi:hypothetical protein FS837_000014 [Tulasnella sp. UAMH 9824]|nr:hypothetical protein FS837_000014 [Tulasnella sp. UAMH 9824]